MKLVYFTGPHPNFGDDLNAWLWPQLLPNFFDDDTRQVFVGIGSILGAECVQPYGPETLKIVVGSGYVPTYHAKPNLHTKDWCVLFVRGPRTSQRLGLPPELAIGDSAILMHALKNLPAPTPSQISFIPHWESLERGNWAEVCRLAGVTLIDPRLPVTTVLGELLKSKLVIAEAMHGAIVADALRVPWLPILPMNKVHRDKWYDWAEALQIDLHPQRLCPSSLLEARLSILRGPITRSPLAKPAEKALRHISAAHLQRLSRHAGFLSDERKLDQACDKMLGCLQQLKAMKR